MIRYLIIKWRHIFKSCLCEYRPQDTEMGESKKDWIKGTSCMYHWMKSKYYKEKLNG